MPRQALTLGHVPRLRNIKWTTFNLTYLRENPSDLHELVKQCLRLEDKVEDVLPIGTLAGATFQSSRGRYRDANDRMLRYEVGDLGLEGVVVDEGR